MVCLIKSKYKNELAEYKRILGSEAAAYYALAANNGYTLDLDPEGNPSKLYEALLAANGADKDAAIMRKVSAYTPQFIDTYGDWVTEGKKEPSIIDVNGGVLTSTSQSISKLFGGSKLKNSLKQLEKQNDLFSRPALIQYYIEDTRKQFVQEQLEKYLTVRENPTASDIYGFNLASQVDWDEQKVKEIIGEQQEKLAKVFGLSKQKRPDGSFVYSSKDKSDGSRLRVAFVNSITGEAWTDENGVEHAGLFQERSKSNEAAWNAIYISITKGDPTTFVHEMVHYYVRTFWDSKPVQEALNEVSKDAKLEGKDSRAIEEALVERISLNTMQDFESKANRNFILKFWDGIKDILHVHIGKALDENKQDQNDIIDTLTAAFSINQDLSDVKADIIYYQKYIGNMYQTTSVQNEPDSLEGSTFWKIKSTLEARQKAERSRGIANNIDLLNVEQYIQKINRRSITNSDDITDTVTDFILLASQDVERAIRVLADIKLSGDDGIQNLNANEFMHLKYDIISYHDKMLNDVVEEYVSHSTNLTDDQKRLMYDQVDQIYKYIATLKREFDKILKQYVNYQIECYANELVTMGDKDQFIANMKLWATNAIDNGDLMPFENTLGPAVNSASPIVRLVEYIVTAQNRATYTSALEVGHELVDKYKKCASIGKKMMSVNFMKQFCDLDDDGNPTGYFARKYNYGKLYKMRDNIIKDLIKKYNLATDDTTGDIAFKTREEYLKYTKDFYDQMDKIANFRYKKEYYIKRAEFLSPEAVKKERQIQRQIDVILNKAMDEELGMPLIFNLTSDDIHELDKLQKEKQNLSNPYIIEYDDRGFITSFKEKEGESLDIALQFMDWNAWKAENIKYTPNWDKFNKAREAIVKRYGEDSYQVKLFDKKYKSRKISDRLYENLPQYPHNQELQELYNRRSIIKNSILNKRGYYVPNLKKLNEDAFKELKRIDKRIEQIVSDRRQGPNTNSGTVSFQEVARKDFVPEYDDNGKLTTNFAFDYFQQLEYAQRQAKRIPQDQESDYTYVNSKGNTTPLSIFKYTVPLDRAYVEDTLLGQFQDLNINSPMVNSEFDQNEREEIQPKHTDQFINKNWQKIQSDAKLKAFYDEILSTMQKAYSMLPNMDAEKMKYVMPQMRDRDAKLLFRNRHILQNFGASIADAFSITERETAYNEDFAKRPDGTMVETIPIRWITRLQDPSIISTDILQTVSMFYEMALNYRNKADINPLLQTLLFQTQGGFSSQTAGQDNSEQASRIQNYLQMYVYGRTRTGLFRSDKPMSKRERLMSRITDTVLSKAHAKLMNHNWRAVLKNFTDSFLTEAGEIFAGKYITVKDALWANMEMGKEIFSQSASFGRANNKSKLAALMQLNGCSGTISEIFGQHNETWLRRIISKHFSMGEYNLVDYTFKGHLTAAVYHSIRLVKNPQTNKEEFMSKDQAMYHYHANGLSMDEGLKAWKNSKVTLWDAYDVDDKGNAVVVNYKEQVYPYVDSIGRRTNRLVNNVAGIIRERSSVINGVLDASGSAKAKQSTIGSMVLQMRGWMISQMWDNLKDGHDFAEYQEEWREIFRKQSLSEQVYYNMQTPQSKKHNTKITPSKYVIVDEDPEFRGQYNFETGTIETGQWRGLGSASLHACADLLNRTMIAYKAIRRVQTSPYQKRLTRNERYKLRRLSMMAATFFIVCACTYITTLATVKWPDKWWLHMISAANISVISERASQLPIFAPLSILDIVNSIVISKTLIEDVDKIISLFGDIIEMMQHQITGDEDYTEYKQPVKSGAYNGVEKWQRDLLKGTSYSGFNLDNVFRSMSESGNKASINYYIHNVAPTKQAYGMSKVIGDWTFGALDIDVPNKEESKSEKKGKKKSF